MNLTKNASLLVMVILLLSCKQDTNIPIEQRAEPGDSICFKEINIAKKQVAKKRIVYCHYAGNIIWQSLRAENEMDSLLKMYDIGYRNEASPCVIEKDNNYHCYCEYMQEQIDLRFGNQFTDSLLYKADSIYILRHVSETFDNKSAAKKWDTPPLFPGDRKDDQSYHSGLQKAFDQLVKYPPGYRRKNGDYSGAMLKLHVDTDQCGQSKVSDTGFIFWDYVTKEEDYNKPFYDDLKNLAVSLVENTLWSPATIKQLSVRSSSEVIISLK